MKATKVALVGFGTIGSGVARILLEKGDHLARHAGRPIELVRVVDKDTKSARNVTLPAGMLTDDLDAVLSDPEIEVVIQLVGGYGFALELMHKVLDSGKSVVTANKALLAEYGPELFSKARKKGQTIAFEAAVAGGIPIIAGIGQSLTANQINSIHAILNGTSNFILTRMEETGLDYGQAVAEAQDLGYAEADPSMDVDGTDAAQKLSILAQLAFDAKVDWRDIPRIGIDTVEVADLEYANALGYSVKLLAVAQRKDEGLELHVTPTLVREGTTMANVTGAFNAVQVVGDSVGPSFFHGLGAGQEPTASAVVADLIDTVNGRAKITFTSLDLWSDTRTASISLREPNDIPGRFYLRFNVVDKMGVMSEIAGVFGEHDISLASLIQHETENDEGDTVPLIMMTHKTTEGTIRRALADLEKLPSVKSTPVRLRVEE
jgi:homoserine dehydrogenase